MPGKSCTSNAKLPLCVLLAVQLYAAAVPVGNNPPANDTAPAMQTALQQQQEALQKQRDSVRQQIGLSKELAQRAGDFISAFPPLPPSVMARLQPDCPALPPEQVDALVNTAAQQQSLEPRLLKAVMKQESGFRPCVISVAGAQGLMQLMPETADLLHVADPFDPAQNVNGGAAYLKQLLTKYKGDLKLSLGAYNAGPKRTDEAGVVPNIPETQNYVSSILADLDSAGAPANTPSDSSKEQKTPAIQN